MRRARRASAARGIGTALGVAGWLAAATRSAHAQGGSPAANTVAPALVPMPRELAMRNAFGVGRGVAVTGGADADDRFAARELIDALRDRRIPIVTIAAPGVVVVRLLRRDTPDGRDALRRSGLTFDTAQATEGYALTTDAGPGGAGGRIDVVAATAAGLFYGAQTIRQVIDGDGPRARVLGVRVRDRPAIRWRGLHDDLSRGGVPTLDFQKQQIRTLAAYKMNVYSPYFEHTLAYASHPLAAPPGGAMTRDDARELSAYARRYHVEIIPEQQAIGHLHHTLEWDRYAGVAEIPHGAVLAPGQAGTLPLVRDGQRLGARGVLTTYWNDDGEALHAQAWTGLLFGGAASWQVGASDPERFLATFARTFHGDTSGHVAAAERALRAAHELLRTAGVGDGTNYVFWVDPWTPEGQIQSAHVLPVARDVRVLAEEAIVRLARARAAGALASPKRSTR